MPGAMGGFLAGSIVAKMLLDKTGWNSSIAGVGSDVNNLKKHTKTLGDQFADLGKTLPKVGLAIVGTFGAMVLKTVEYQHELTHLSEKTGMSVEDLSSMKLALESTDSSLEDFTFSMKFLSNHMADAAAKNPAAIKTFDDLKVSFQNADLSLRPLKDVFIDIADKLSKMENGAKKNSLAVDLFGRSGMNLIPTLNLGREGLEKFIERAKELGLVVSTKSATAAAEMKEKMIELKLSFEAATQKLAVAVIPMLTTFVEKVTEVVAHIGKWIEQNPELIKQLGETALKAGALMMAVILLTNPIYAVAAAAAAAVVIFIQLQDAEDKAMQAAARFDQTNAALGQKLREAADAAGLSRVQFHELSEKYNENYAAMAMAIEKGNEGVILQQTLAEVGKKHKIVIDEQVEALKKQKEALENSKRAGEQFLPPFIEIGALTDSMGLISIPRLNKKLDQESTLLMDARTAAWNFCNVPLDGWNNRVVPSIDEVNEHLRELIPGFGEVLDSNEEMISIFESEWKDLENNIAGCIADMVMNITGLSKMLLFQPKEFDDSYWRQMEDAANRAYDSVRGAAQDAFSEQELLIKRQQEDEDIRYKREYDAQREAIKNSSMNTEEKNAALYALEIKYEDDKLARERKREDEKLAREKQQKIDLLALETQHEIDIQKIRDDADEARKKHDQDELDRQNSLWSKIKEIAFQAIDDIIKKWAIDLLENIIEKKTKETVGGAVTDLGTTVGGSLTTLATSIGTIITTLATAVATGIVTIATGIATVIVTLATGIATAATILAAAAPALLIVGGIALALYAGFSLISSLFGGGGGNDDITYWLKMIKDLNQEMHDVMVLNYLDMFESWNSLFESDNYCLYELHGRLVETRDAISYWGQTIVDSINHIPHAQAGATFMSPTLAFVGEQAPGIPEIVMPEPIYERNLQMAAAMGGGQPGQPIELYINGEPVKFPLKENMRKIMVELVPYMTKNEQLKIHTRAVRAF